MRHMRSSRKPVVLNDFMIADRSKFKICSVNQQHKAWLMLLTLTEYEHNTENGGNTESERVYRNIYSTLDVPKESCFMRKQPYHLKWAVKLLKTRCTFRRLIDNMRRVQRNFREKKCCTNILTISLCLHIDLKNSSRTNK